MAKPYSISKFNKELFADIESIPLVLSQNELPSLNGIRAVSILFVLVAHVNDRYDNRFLLAIVGGGRLGVYIFFVISGFLITTLLIKEKIQEKRISLSKFYTRRFLRIIPVAFLYLFILFIISHCFNVQLALREYIGAAFFLMNYSYFHTGVWLTGHYWSLSGRTILYYIPILIK